MSLFASSAALGIAGSFMAWSQVSKLEKQIVAHKKYQRYLEKLATGLEEIANNPKSDPIENRAAVDVLLVKIKGDMLLDGIDFDKEAAKLHE